MVRGARGSTLRRPLAATSSSPVHLNNTMMQPSRSCSFGGIRRQHSQHRHHNHNHLRFLSSSAPTAALGGASPKLTGGNDGNGKAPPVTVTLEAAAGAKAAVGDAGAERDFDLKIVQSILPYIWPKDKPEHRLRVVGALSLLVTSKFLNVGTPFLFKFAVDALAIGATGVATGPAALAAVPLGAAVALTPAAMLMGYGVSRAGASFCNELRNATFAKVGRLYKRNAVDP